MSMRELEVTGAFKGVRCQLDERGVSGVPQCPAFPGLSLRVCVDINSHLPVHTRLLIYSLYVICNVLCPLSSVGCMCAFTFVYACECSKRIILHCFLPDFLKQGLSVKPRAH